MATKKGKSKADAKTASTSETGHAKNVANFETLIIDCQGFGASYNPSNASITITAMQLVYTNSGGALTDINTKKNAAATAINTREVLFIPLKALATQVMAALMAGGANAQTLLNARTIDRKIQGSRAVKKIATTSTPTPTTTPTTTPTASTEKTAAAATPHNISVAQLSYDNLVANFSNLVSYVSLQASYNPNEANLKVAALNTTATGFTTANNNVKSAHTALDTSMANRTTILYSPTTGLVQVAKEAKAYVKSVYGAKSPQYKQVEAVHFRTDHHLATKKHHKKAK